MKLAIDLIVTFILLSLITFYTVRSEMFKHSFGVGRALGVLMLIFIWVNVFSLVIVFNSVTQVFNEAIHNLENLQNGIN